MPRVSRTSGAAQSSRFDHCLNGATDVIAGAVRVGLDDVEPGDDRFKRDSGDESCHCAHRG
jgi:hypothetical protein